MALGVYNWGIYIGFSLTFVFEFILNATDWRWVFRIGAIPGMFVAVLLAVTVLEPKRQQHSVSGCVACNIQSDHTYPHTSVLDEIADIVRELSSLTMWYWINEGALV